MLSFEQATLERDRLNSEVDRCSAALKMFPRSAMGLTPDDVKTTPAYREARAAYAVAFVNLRRFNETYVKRFRNEIRAARHYARKIGLSSKQNTKRGE